MENVATRTVIHQTAQKLQSNTAMRKQRPIFLWGPPGIGKSDIIHQITDSFDKLTSN